MSTNASIGIKDPNGKVRAITVHFDGYPGHAGAVLGGWYKATEKVEALLALGDLRSLEPEVANCEAYYRDRGEPLVPAVTYFDEDEYKRNGNCDYLYLFANGRWLVYGLYNDPEWNELEVIIGEEN